MTIKNISFSSATIVIQVNLKMLADVITIRMDLFKERKKDWCAWIHPTGFNDQI